MGTFFIGGMEAYIYWGGGWVEVFVGIDTQHPLGFVPQTEILQRISPGRKKQPIYRFLVYAFVLTINTRNTKVTGLNTQNPYLINIKCLTLKVENLYVHGDF